MLVDDLIKQPLRISIQDETLPADEEKLLKCIQGNILKKNGGGIEALVLLNFGQEIKEEQTAKLRNKLSAYSKKVTNAYKQLDMAKRKKDGGQLETFLGFYLTYFGYVALQIPEERIPKDSSFRSGMKNVDLGDPPSEEWERVFDNEIHGMFLIIDDNKSDVESKIEELKEDWDNEIIGVQFGRKLTNRFDDTIEHFGYVDGISQPLFFQDEIDNDKRTYWDPRAPLSIVLVEEQNGEEESENANNSGRQDTTYGSYLVYRKLEQNVKAFKKAEKHLAHELGFSGETEEVAGALMVGRFENGLPVVKFGSTERPDEPSKENDFLYDIDPEGTRCPYHSHIRKTNPRGDSKRFFGTDMEAERDHRIARRAITYDDIGRGDDLSYHPERGVGLLFMCFQSSIENQFEFIQKSWANNNDFPKPFSGIDPVIGHGENRVSIDGSPAEQKWTDIFGNRKCQSISSFVTMKGGEYFFAPSITFLENL